MERIGVRKLRQHASLSLHLASALLLREDLTAFVAYDARLAGAAQDAGLATASPGR